MNEQLLHRIRQCPNLPSLPAIAVQVLDLAQKPDVDIAEIARIISRDPALSTKILRTVNSSFYARSQHVGDDQPRAGDPRACSRSRRWCSGSRWSPTSPRARARGSSTSSTGSGASTRATAARTIAAKLGVVQQEEAFLAALLQDIGMLVLDQVLGEEYGADPREGRVARGTARRSSAPRSAPTTPRSPGCWPPSGSCRRC